MATTTFKDLIDYMADTFDIGRRGINTATSASSITADLTFGGHGAAEDIEVGCEVTYTDDATATADPEAEVTQLSSRPKLTTGVMNVDPDFTANPESGDAFLILKRPLSFNGGQHGLVQAINQAITERPWENRLVPITSVTDGDMLATGTSDWTAIDGAGGANVPTLAKTAASFPLGLRVLRVTNNATGAGDYAQSVKIPVEADENYYLEATGMIASTGVAADAGTLVLFDVTNGANITLDNSAIDRFEPETLVNPDVALPIGCEQVEIRLTCTLVNDIIDWSSVIFRKNNSKEFTVADRGLPASRIGNLFVSTTPDWAERGDRMTPVSGKPRQVGNGIWQFRTERAYGGRSLWYEEFYQSPTFSALAATGASTTVMAETTYIDKEALGAVAAEILLKPLARQEKWHDRYLYAAQEAVLVRQGYMEAIQTVVQPQRVVFQPRV